MPCRRGKPSELGSCKARAIAFCGFGTTRSSPISTASIRRSPPRWAASPPPKPSPIKGEGLRSRPLEGAGRGGGDARQSEGARSAKGSIRSETLLAGGDSEKTKPAPEAVAPSVARQAPWLELMLFFIREAWLLDERRFKEWLELFTH